MVALDLSTPFVTFPTLLIKKYRLSEIKLRPYGTTGEDLEIDFDLTPLPLLVTKILESCTVCEGKPLPEEFFMDLSIGKRIECLLRIVFSIDSHPLVILLNCLSDQCNKTFELNLRPEDILRDDTQGKNDHCVVKILGQQISFRRPIGFDQLNWLNIQNKDKLTIIKEIIKTMVDGQKIDHLMDNESSLYAIMKLVNENMSLIDPLIFYTIQLSCPYCESKYNYEIDLEEIAIKKLRHTQQSLLKCIHQLALSYHWSEHQILSIPFHRRQLYLSLIDGVINI